MPCADAPPISAAGSNLVALNATTGAPLCDSTFTISYELDGQQYVVVGAGFTLWSFAMKK
jgi:hypothetical protein